MSEIRAVFLVPGITHARACVSSITTGLGVGVSSAASAGACTTTARRDSLRRLVNLSIQEGIGLESHHGKNGSLGELHFGYEGKSD